MGCTSCGGTGKSSCKGNGGCATGGCNRLNVYDWLADIPLADSEDRCQVMEISFNQGSRKDFYRNNTSNYFTKGDVVAVEGVGGFDVGTINLAGELVRLQLKKRNIQENSPEIRKILRLASDNDIAKWKETKGREREVLIRSRALARQLNLNLKMSEVEIQADARKATFFYIADERVDFRELIKIYASEFKVKVEMKQIGARQEAGKVGGIGSSGRELCSSTWLTCFKSVNTNAARYQNLSINQTKLSGQCGRLKNCLNFELDTYLDALQYFPDNAEVLEVAKGRAFLVKKDIFRNLMWYSMADNTKHYPLSLETVKKIKALNKEGIKPEALETEEVVSGKLKEVEPEFVDVVGQISLRSLEKSSRKHKSGGNNDRRNQKTPQASRNQQHQAPRNQGNSPRPNNNNRNRPPQKPNRDQP
ncbi:MAG: regulatory iron-sulfur-containing complex subunit RicT [Ginsengibacter sp.]